VVYHGLINGPDKRYQRDPEFFSRMRMQPLKYLLLTLGLLIHTLDYCTVEFACR